jgi:uncharacterized damage-inducible protein DinB
MDIKTFPVYYQTYIEKVPKGDPILLLEMGVKETIKTLVMVTEEKANWAYAEGKWSIKDIVQHIIDTERIFSYRALCFARGEVNSINGYDHNAYVDAGAANDRSLKDLLEELKRLRLSTIDLFKSFSKEMLAKKGNANGTDLTTEQVLFILLGHEIHHMEVVQERYLNV